MALNVSSLPCTKCGRILPTAAFNRDAAVRCMGCNATIMVEVYPALVQSGGEAPTGERLPTDEEASCFYHTGKRASIVCDNCGRFLCALCDVRIGQRNLCPSCIGSFHGRQSSSSAGLGRQRVLYDSLALLLAVLPFGFTPLISLYLAIRYWSTPVSVLPRGRVRWVLAIAIAVGQICCWGVWLYSLWS